MADTPGDDRTLRGDATPLPDSHHVDITQAEVQFNELQRILSIRSQQADSERTQSANEKDLETGKQTDEPFDLRAYLSSSSDAAQQAGIAHKHVGVTWDNLQVVGVGGVGHKVFVQTFGQYALDFWFTPFYWLRSFSQMVVPALRPQLPLMTILQPQSGLLKPGELCLVLGCPGSGCTTLLKALANQRQDYAQIIGDVRYAGIDAQSMAKYFKGEVVYNEEDDQHIATLTVAQNLNFALSLKTPGPSGRLPGVSRKEFDESVRNMLLRMLNISHTANTYVGDEFVRGVSGGERKRVSIAEMMATRAHVLCFDNSTRGLDASTALDFIKAMRVMTNILGQTTFATLYQAGESIYELFDKVIVLDKGRQVYFGPPSEARAYFEGLGYKSLPRQSTPDYLTGCTDPNERQFAPGRSELDVPSTPEALEDAFLKSRFGGDLHQSLQSYKEKMEVDRSDQETFRAAVLADKKRGVSKKSPYTLGFTGQVRSLFIRQFTMRLQDRFQLITSFTISTSLALIIGAAYYNLQPNAQGAFTRGGVIFAGLLTCALDTFGEMPVQMLGRPILKKQTNYALYRPAAVAIANTLSDMPFSAVRVFVYNLIIYFMSGLSRSAGGFFTYHLFIYLAFLTMQGFFRTFGIMCTNFDSAFRLATFFIPNMILYTGYMIPVFEMKRWLFWIYYINPMAFAFVACLENEFMRISFSCDGSAIVPRNPPGINKYPTDVGPNQICTLFGSSPAQALVSGRTYIDVGFGLMVSDLWRRNFLVLLGFFVVFQLTQVILIEYFPHFGGGSSITVFVPDDSETKDLNAALRKHKERKAENREDKDLKEKTNEAEGSTTKFSGKPFTWEKVNYHVPVSGGTRRLLHDVYGYVRPGTMTALMGASGAGKTTCLDVLAQRKNIGVVSGTLLLDGKALDLDFARNTAYAEQMDVHEGTATIREAMRFSAYLRQPADVTKEEKDTYVEEMIEVLELHDIADAMVSSLSVEARKRLTIGVELASRPSLLFLDEPTSGLDAQSAWNLVRFLRKLADNGQAILCTIHQPSAMLIQTFDKLLLLERGGETVYFGDIGPDCYILRDYFARHGAHCPPTVNPAEFMLDAIGAGLTPRIGERDWKDHWLESKEYHDALSEIEKIKQGSMDDGQRKKKTMYATPFWHQLRYVVQRNNRRLWRSPDYVYSRLFVHGFISLWVSLSFLQLGNGTRDLQYRIFGIFWVTILPAIVMGQLEPMWILSRRIFIREASSRIYSPYVFAIGQLIGEMPYSLLCAVFYWVLMIFPMGFGQGSAGVGGQFFQLLVIIFMELFGVSLGQFIGAISPSMQIAPLFNPFIILVLGTFCGVTIPYPSLPNYWHWLYQLSPYTRALSAMVGTELHGLEIRCKSSEFVQFDPPAGQTCAAWASEFIQGFGGYLDNPDANSACRYCQYSVGEQFFVPLNIRYENRWRDVWILFAFCVFNLFATIVASRFLRYAKR